jgi:hypothetical protein
MKAITMRCTKEQFKRLNQLEKAGRIGVNYLVLQRGSIFNK